MWTVKFNRYIISLKCFFNNNTGNNSYNIVAENIDFGFSSGELDYDEKWFQPWAFIFFYEPVVV